MAVKSVGAFVNTSLNRTTPTEDEREAAASDILMRHNSPVVDSDAYYAALKVDYSILQAGNRSGVADLVRAATCDSSPGGEKLTSGEANALIEVVTYGPNTSPDIDRRIEELKQAVDSHWDWQPWFYHGAAESAVEGGEKRAQTYLRNAFNVEIE